jgi:hypothetical protein
MVSTVIVHRCALFAWVKVMFMMYVGTEDERYAVMNAVKGVIAPTRRSSVSLRSTDKLYNPMYKSDVVAEWTSNQAQFGQNLQVTFLYLRSSANKTRQCGTQR